MNRRDLFKGAAALAVSAALPQVPFVVDCRGRVGQIPMGRPVEPLSPDMVDAMRYAIAAACHLPVGVLWGADIAVGPSETRYFEVVRESQRRFRVRAEPRIDDMVITGSVSA